VSPGRSVFLGIGASLAVLAGPAFGQIAEGRSGSSTMGYVSGSEVYAELGIFGRCFASQQSDEALSLIATEPGSRAEAEVYKKLFTKPYQSCLGDVVEMRMPISMVRGAIAEGLYAKHVALPASLVLAPPADGAEIHSISEAARCYAATHPAEVQSLLATKPGSKKEFEQVKAMARDFTKCVPAKARKLPFEPTLVRFRLAEATLKMNGAAAAATGKN